MIQVHVLMSILTHLFMMMEAGLKMIHWIVNIDLEDIERVHVVADDDHDLQDSFCGNDVVGMAAKILSVSVGSHPL